MNAYCSKDEIIQNLKDAGCSKKQIDELMLLYENGKKEDICKILEKHRKCILNTVHENEKKIDCLDYFLYQIEKEKNNESNRK